METQTYIEANSLNEEELIIKWESKYYGVAYYEQHFPTIPCSIKQGTVLSFCKEQTDDKNRVQYDLFVEALANDGDSIIYGIGSNLYNKQCDARVKEIILENRLD